MKIFCSIRKLMVDYSEIDGSTQTQKEKKVNKTKIDNSFTNQFKTKRRKIVIISLSHPKIELN